MMWVCSMRSQLKVAQDHTWVHGDCDLLSAALASWRQPQRQPLRCCICI